MNYRLVVFPLVAGGLVVSACSSEEALTAEAFRTEANAICAAATTEAGAALDALVNDAAEDPSKIDIEEVVGAGVDVLRVAVDDIDKLVPPEEMAADVDAWITASQTAFDAIGELSAEDILAGADPFTEADTLAAELGLATCAQ